MYIRATGNISPQKTFGHPFLSELVTHTGNRMSCIEPDYKELIDVKLIRRMSRIIRMGVAAATACLQEAAVKEPDAIVTGTAYGCLEDTGLFLTKMVEHNEELLTPTAFIQSTHNTIGAQIALMLHCHGYNNAFVHRGFSFESALLDTIMLLKEKEAETVLVGGVDEITNISHAILTRMGLYRREQTSNLDLIKHPSKGTIAGEGAAFFLLADQPSATDYAKLEGITTFYKPAGSEDILEHTKTFLTAHSITIHDIDLVITGRNGDIKGDKIYDQLQATLFNKHIVINYKDLCGEYPTAAAFAMWMAANIIKSNAIPPVLQATSSTKKDIKRILIYNHSQETHHSLLLITAC